VNGRLAPLLVPLFVSLAACGGRHGPDAAAREIVEAVRDATHGQSTAGMEELYSRLSIASRAMVEERQKSAREVLGVELPAWKILRFEGLVRGQRVTATDVISRDGDRALVEVQLAWAVPPDAGGPPPPQPVEVELAREDGAWRWVVPWTEGAP